MALLLVGSDKSLALHCAVWRSPWSHRGSCCRGLRGRSKHRWRHPPSMQRKKNTIGNYEGFLCQTNINFVQWPAAGNHIRRKKWFIKSWWLSKKRRSYITIFWPFFTYEEILLVVWDSNPNFILGCEPSFCLRVVWDLHSNFRTGRDAPSLCKKRVPLHVEIIVKRIRHRCESVG